ncbi:hypothetical protein BC938DRAFT_476247 [Jimgerdemannia flammicorona]|uniref:Uncharacterized protein n=1 Tax=Jimgerdemannia flammicorona TaxID=994334 RepID=A0A433PIY1_9FUNG|nr:hypothetical protein BC938DRAFT_476247 [Jimgerdemannia flammicorona]
MLAAALRRGYTTDTWHNAFRSCTTPLQLRTAIHRLFYKHPTPHQQTIVQALNACSRLALTAPQTTANGATWKRFKSDIPRTINSIDSFLQSQTHADQPQPYTPADLAHLARDTIIARLPPGTLTPPVYASYIRLLADAREIALAHAVFKAARTEAGIIPSLEMYKAVLSACAKDGDLSTAFDTIESAARQAGSIFRTELWLKIGIRLVLAVDIGKYLALCVEGLVPGVPEGVGVGAGIAVGVLLGGRLAMDMVIREAGDFIAEEGKTKLKGIVPRRPEELRREMYMHLVGELEREGRAAEVERILKVMRRRRLTFESLKATL